MPWCISALLNDKSASSAGSCGSRSAVVQNAGVPLDLGDSDHAEGTAMIETEWADTTDITTVR